MYSTPLVGGVGNRCAPTFDCSEHVRTPHGITRVWPRPGKEPHQDIDGTVFVSILDESTCVAAIGAFPERHGLLVSTPTADLRRLACI